MKSLWKIVLVAGYLIARTSAAAEALPEPIITIEELGALPGNDPYYALTQEVRRQILLQYHESEGVVRSRFLALSQLMQGDEWRKFRDMDPALQLIYSAEYAALLELQEEHLIEELRSDVDGKRTAEVYKMSLMEGIGIGFVGVLTLQHIAQRMTRSLYLGRVWHFPWALRARACEHATRYVAKSTGYPYIEFEPNFLYLMFGRLNGELQARGPLREVRGPERWRRQGRLIYYLRHLVSYGSKDTPRIIEQYLSRQFWAESEEGARILADIVNLKFPESLVELSVDIDRSVNSALKAWGNEATASRRLKDATDAALGRGVDLTSENVRRALRTGKFQIGGRKIPSSPANPLTVPTR